MRNMGVSIIEEMRKFKEEIKQWKKYLSWKMEEIKKMKREKQGREIEDQGEMKDGKKKWVWNCCGC